MPEVQRKVGEPIQLGISKQWQTKDKDAASSRETCVSREMGLESPLIHMLTLLKHSY